MRNPFSSPRPIPNPQFLQNEQSEFTCCALSGHGLVENCFRCFLKCSEWRGPFAGQGENPWEGSHRTRHLHKWTSPSHLIAASLSHRAGWRCVFPFFLTNILETVTMCQGLANPWRSGSHPDRRETDKETGTSEHKEGTPESCGSGQASSSRGHLYRGIR